MRYIDASTTVLVLVATLALAVSLHPGDVFAGQREDQIMIFSSLAQLGDTPEFLPVGPFSAPPQPGEERLLSVELDGRKYPPGTTFRLEVTLYLGGLAPACVRLFNSTANAPVPGSEICRSNPSQFESFYDRGRSTPFLLVRDPHEYIVQYRAEGDPAVGFTGGGIQVARIIAKWMGW